MIISNTFTPFFGFVEDVDDPQKLGRVRVRVTGYHTQNRGVLSTDDLIWFMCLVNNSESQSGVGTTPKYNVGSMVFGYFVDNSLQDGFVMGSFNGNPDGNNDINPLARNEEIDSTIVPSKKSGVESGIPKASGGSWSEPETPYNASYPDNHVTETDSGHIIELDDTQGAERLHVYHRSGSFYEVHPDGSQVVKIVTDNYTIVAGDGYFFVDGNASGFVGGNNDLNIDGNNDLRIGGNNTVTIEGSENITIEKSQNVNIQQSQNISVDGVINMDAASINMTAGTISLTGALVFTGNISHAGAQQTTGPLSALTVSSAQNDLDDHIHPYSWTDPGGSSVTGPAQ